MLSDQDEVRFEGPAKRGDSNNITWQYNQGFAGYRPDLCICYPKELPGERAGEVRAERAGQNS